MKVEARTFELRHRKTRWWGRRRWDCLVTSEGMWLGWSYQYKENAERHLRILRAFEATVSRTNPI